MIPSHPHQIQKNVTTHGETLLGSLNMACIEEMPVKSGKKAVVSPGALRKLHQTYLF